MRFFFIVTFLLVAAISFSQTYVIVADHLIDVRNEKVIDNPAIIIQNKMITDIRYDQNYPADAVVINLKGYSLYSYSGRY